MLGGGGATASGAPLRVAPRALDSPRPLSHTPPRKNAAGDLLGRFYHRTAHAATLGAL